MELNFKGLYLSSKKRIRKLFPCCLVFTATRKSETSELHVVVGQRRKRNVQKKRDERAEVVVLSI